MQTNKIFAIGVMRTVCILGVLLIHTTTKVLENAHYDLINFQSTLFLNQVARFAVPLFFLISGFVLEISAGKDIALRQYYKKRFARTLVPYATWSMIYYFFVYPENNDNLLKVFLTGNASYQLYFIPTLFIFYLIFPLLHKLQKIFTKPFIFGMMFLTQIYLMEKDYAVAQFAYAEPIRIFLLSHFFFIAGIVFAGMRQAVFDIANKIKYFLLPITAYLIYFIFEEARERYFLTWDIKAFYSQWRAEILLYTGAIFALLSAIFEKKKFQFPFLFRTANLSFFVFFSHIIVLEVVWKYLARPLFDINGDKVYIFSFDILFFALVVILSFGSAYLMRKVPNVSKILG